MPAPDYYETLQIRPDAGLGVIKAAYKALAQAMHPDRNDSPSAGDEMARINAAYAVLSDETKRARYDRLRAEADDGSFDENEVDAEDDAYEDLGFDWTEEDSPRVSALVTILEAVPIPEASPPDWSACVVTPTPLPPEVEQARRKFRPKKIAVLSAATVVLLLTWLFSLEGAVAVAVAMLFFAMWRPYLTAERNARQRAASQAVGEHEAALADWDRKVSNRALYELQEVTHSEVTAYEVEICQQREYLKTLFDAEAEAQIETYLKSCTIADCSVSGLGPKRKQTLIDYGIDSAYELDRYQLERIPGFGAGLVSALLSWKRTCNESFEATSLSADATAELRELYEWAKEHEAWMVSTLQQAGIQAYSLVSDTEAARAEFLPQFEKIAMARAQAIADLIPLHKR